MFARGLRDEKGSAAVEFALVAPTFIILLFGIFQVGWAMHCASSTRYALEQESRALSLDHDLTASALQAAIIARLTNLADPNVSVTMVSQNVGGVPAKIVTATYNGVIIVPLAGDFPFNLASTVTVPLVTP